MGSYTIDPLTGARRPVAEPHRTMSRAERRAAEQAAVAEVPAPAPAEEPKPARRRAPRPAEAEAPIGGETVAATPSSFTEE